MIVPARVYADTAIAGTRRPSRSNVKPISPGSASTVGGVALGGGTWSYVPPCSSNVMSSRVFIAFEPSGVALCLIAS